MKTALVLGATGLVGSEVVKQLLDQPEYEKVHILIRRAYPLQHLKLEQHLVDFDHLDRYQDLFQVDDVFCCLGTTIKIAGTKEAFKKVDYTYPVEAARLAKANQVKNYLIITAMGANPRSSIFYNQVKGEVEVTLQSLHLPSLHIFRPSLLLGERAEFRLGERIAIILSPILNALMIGPLRPYRAIQAKTVAQAMVQMAQTEGLGTHIYSSHQIAEIARK